MVRKAIVIGAVLMALPASAQQTNCVWIGQTLSCNTQQTNPAPTDQSKILQSGMGLVPSYPAPRYSPPPIATKPEYEPIDGELAIEQCELDWPAIQQPGHPRRKQKAFFGGYLPEADRVQFVQICSAYIKGKLSVTSGINK